MGLLGCSIYSQYALCVAHTNDYVSAAEFVEASSGLLLTWGIGAVIGPLAAAVAMNWLGSGGLFAFTAVIHLLFCLFALYRMTRRAAVPVAEREHCLIQPGASRITPTALELDPRAAESLPVK